MLAAAFGLAAPALAQGVDNGLEVRVNPYAASGSGQTLLYPGGEYSRTVPQLLYPGQPSGPIQLHMPSKRARTVVARKTPAAPADTFFSSTPAEPKPVPKPKPVKVAKAAPPPPQPPQPQQSAPVDNNNPYFGGPSLGNVFGGQPAPKAPPPKKLASAAPSPSSAPTAEPGLTKRSVILFAKDAADPAEGALKSIGFLASDLNAAMTGPSSRVELQAYGGAHGDKGSDARRLSLKRALAIRQILIGDGVSPDRIDVRAMGGTDDSGPGDRVDVFVRA
jgi:outer membrane protein OmpA-like peptidoglycan-associated protein